MNGTRKALLAFDTDRIMDYVFGVDTLKEIRGASALLDSLNRDVMKAIVGQEPIYANGGSALFLVEEERVEELRREVESVYHRETAGAASVTGATLSLPPDCDPHRDMQAQVCRLLLRMRRNKDRPPEFLALTSLPHVKPCDLCGVLPAEKKDPREADRLVCLACERRREGNREEGRGLWPRRGMETGFDSWDELLNRIKLAAYRPGELNEIAALSRPHGYIGLIYADGNGMGRVLEQLKSDADIKQFSVGVDQAIFKAAGEAVQNHLHPVDDLFPFDILLLGGDDLVMVTRAQSALDVAVTLVKRFEEHTNSLRGLTGKTLTLSAAVVLAHSHFPFRLMFDLAQGALKFAKREGAKRKVDSGLINFLVVTSAAHLDFKEYYEKELRHRPDPGQPTTYFRTLRPYTPDDLRDLLVTARSLRDAPRNKLQALGECVFGPFRQSVLEALTVLRHWRGDAQRGPRVEQIHRLRRLVDPTNQDFPWRRIGSDWWTPLLDLTEVFDFVKDG